MLHYTYTATGQKISQQLEDDGRLGTRREYAGPFVYVNSTLGWLNTPYGRIVALPRGGFHKELHLRDHLGNTRMVLEEIDSKYEVVQEAAYYPFGMAIPSQSFALPNENDTYQNRYLYNGKEYQDDFGLNWYDYGARFYDAQIARWHSVDPLAEWAYNLTPYRYGFNNPISFIDPDGMFESREEAKEWAKKEGIKTGWFRRHKIQKNDDGTYAINNRKEGISYFRDDTFQADENSTTIGMSSDGVIKSVLISASGNTNNKTPQYQRGGKIFTTSSGPAARSPNPIYATKDVRSINIDYLQIGFGASKFKQSQLDLAKAFKNSGELWKMRTNREIKLEGTNDRTNTRGQLIDDNGRPYNDTLRREWWKGDGYVVFEGDSMWWENSLENGEIYKTPKKSIH